MVDTVSATPGSTAIASIDLTDPSLYVNRELSWLEFNDRVLAQAFDWETPLLERARFLSICAGNLDEYYQMRFAALKRQAVAGVTSRTPDGLSPTETLAAVDARAEPMMAAADTLWVDDLHPALRREGVHVLDPADLGPDDQRHLRRAFLDQIFPVLTPLAVDPGHPFPYISNLSLSLALLLTDPEGGRDLFARVKVPVGMLPRFVPLPGGPGTRFVRLEHVISGHLEYLFPGMVIRSCHAFRVTRNADIVLEEDATDDLLAAIEVELKRRRFGEVVRLEVADTMPEEMLDLLIRELEVPPEDVFRCRAMLALSDLHELAQLDRPELKHTPWLPVAPARLALVEGRRPDFFAAIREGDLLVHHPYDSFDDTVGAFIAQAARDPAVVAIKQTLYRTVGTEGVVPALIEAADAGKQVAVLVELKARGDEEANIAWARELERAGVHVVYGLVGLKTHCKSALVIRRERDGIRRYFHIGTGNYNPLTARVYTDLGLLSCRDDLGADLTDLFNFLTGYSRQRAYRKLLVAPLTLRRSLLELIEREIAHAKVGQAALITMKMNSLVDPEMIQALYRASQAGVTVRLNVRGICCLRPELADVSERIAVVSIVDRFLEHSRIFRFENAGRPSFYIGSADLMERNLNARVEVVIPVEDERLHAELDEILELSFADNRSAWDMRADGSWTRRAPGADDEPRRLQTLLMERAAHRSRPPDLAASEV